MNDLIAEIERVLVRDLMIPSSDPQKIEQFLKYYYKHDRLKYSLEFFQKDEKPLMVIGIDYEYTEGNAFGNPEGLLWMTDQRIFFAAGIKENLFKKSKPLYHQFYYSNIASIEYRKGGALTQNRIVFHISTSSAQGKVAKTSYESFSEHNLEKFVTAVRERIGKLARQRENLPSASDTQKDIVSELRELARLKEAGLLTDDEFEQAKRKLLS